MNDISEAIGEIYDAVGDAERWQRLSERLSAARRLPPEIALHLQEARRAHEQHVRLSTDVEMLTSVYDQAGLGTLVVTRDASFTRANATATRLLAATEGLELVDDRVRARDPDDDARLQAAITRAITNADDQVDGHTPPVIVRRPGKQPLTVLALYSTSSMSGFLRDRLTVTLLLIDPDGSAVPEPETLRALYGFTAREAEFAAMVMRGLSLKDASVAMGVSITTARTFLARTTCKTDSHSQAELVLRLFAVPRAHRNNG